jgi:hypothetical protein
MMNEIDQWEFGDAMIEECLRLLEATVTVAEERADEFWPETLIVIRHEANKAAELTRKLAAIIEREDKKHLVIVLLNMLFSHITLLQQLNDRLSHEMRQSQ